MSSPTPDTSSLLMEIRALVHAARATASRQVNSLVVLTNFEVGRRIVLHEQGGLDRAAYGKAVLQNLSEALAGEFGRGWSVTNLTLMRSFYLAYRDRPPISQTPSAISDRAGRQRSRRHRLRFPSPSPTRPGSP